MSPPGDRSSPSGGLEKSASTAISTIRRPAGPPSSEAATGIDVGNRPGDSDAGARALSSREESLAPLEYVTRREDAVADLALELIGFDTQNPPGETTAIVDWLERYFDELGVSTERVAVDSNKPNLLARIPGETDRTLLYVGHLDTVPFDAATWRYDPLGERVADRVYGRGATDMKGAVASMVQTAWAFLETDTTPPMRLAFAFVSDEETGGEAGMNALLEETGLTADGCVIGETTCDRDRPSIAVADRGYLWLTLGARGKATHGSRPMLGDNAIDRLWGAIETVRRVVRRRHPAVDAELAPIIAESVDYYAPLLGRGPTRDLFAGPTLNLGVVAGGTAVNAVPDGATAELDVRLTAGVPAQALLADTRDELADHDGISLEVTAWCDGTYDGLDSPIVTAATRLVHEVTGERVYRRSATGSGDARYLRAAGIPAIEVALGSDTLHAVDEYTTVQALAGNNRIYTLLPYAFEQQLEWNDDE